MYTYNTHANMSLLLSQLRENTVQIITNTAYHVSRIYTRSDESMHMYARSCMGLGGSEGLQETYLQHVEHCLTSPDASLRLCALGVVATVNRYVLGVSN